MMGSRVETMAGRFMLIQCEIVVLQLNMLSILNIAVVIPSCKSLCLLFKTGREPWQSDFLSWARNTFVLESDRPLEALIPNGYEK